MRPSDLCPGAWATYREFHERYGPQVAARYLSVVSSPDYLRRKPINDYMGPQSPRSRTRKNHECNHQTVPNPTGH